MNNTENDQNLTLPGQLLLKAREQKDISAETVAQRLRLSVDLIHALENDDYEQFPAVAYVRGHIRGYANFVGLNGDLLVKSYDQSAKVEPAIEPFASRPEPQAASGDKHIKAVTYSLIAALILLVGLWWQTHRSVPRIPVALNNEVLMQPEAQEENPVEQIILEGSDGVLLLPEISQETSPIQEEPKELEHSFKIKYLSAMPEPPEQRSETGLPVINTTFSEQGSISNQEQLVSEPSVTTLIEDQGFVMQFTDESWVQITDSTDTKQFSGLGQTGDVVNVTGLAPFKIVIGKASAVIMSYQGDFIDLDSLAKDEVARFTVDESGAYRYR